MSCPHCHVPLESGARFCPACGKATVPTETAPTRAHGGSSPDLAGREIAGRYRIIKKLGEGGMGAVYRGEQISLKRAVAVKLLRPGLGSNQLILRRFNAEAEAVAKLSHPNTVNIYDFGQDADGSLFIAMEFIEGRSLRAVVQEEAPFSLQRALSIAVQVAASLSDAHAHSIVHRDLKPDNVMLQERGRQKDVVRVLDFGIAKLRDDSRATQQAMTQDGDMLGTPQYMAPEQIKGETIDGRTDIYALGCMIYEMVTARLPFEGPTIMAILSKHLIEDVVPPTRRRPELALPPAIDQLVLAAMAKEPNARPATMEQYSEMISALLATLPADPNRSAGMSIRQGIVGSTQQSAVGPGSAFHPAMPPAGFAPGFPPPAAFPQMGFAPQPGFAQPTPPHALPPPGPLPQIAPTSRIVLDAPEPNSRRPLYAILAVLVLAGAGVGVWAATRGDANSSGASEGSGTGVTDPDTDLPPDPDVPGEGHGGDPWSGAGPDPWSSSSGSPPPPSPPPPPDRTPPPSGLSTAKMPLPEGVKFSPPPGFIKLAQDAESITYVDEKRGLAIAMASIVYEGTNDPAELAKRYSEDTGAALVEKTTTTSAGAKRDALVFSTTVNDVQVLQAFVLYIGRTYRFAVVYQAPVATWADEAFQREVDVFFLSNVRLP